MDRMDFLTDAHNLISKPQLHSYVTGCFGIKTSPKWPVQFGSYMAFGPNARRSRSRLATVPDTRKHGITHTIKTVLKRSVRFGSSRAFGLIAPRHRSGSTQSNLGTSLRSYVTGRFRIKGVLKRPAVKDISRKSPCEVWLQIYNLARLKNYEIWIVLKKLIQKTCFRIDIRHREGFKMLIWRCINA